ncbi:MAG: ABC transporter substrate-binding protein [Mobilicoccus sp.]|nr:ABC transporter substrate-binding protein [Mobilicoccus sp.]
MSRRTLTLTAAIAAATLALSACGNGGGDAPGGNGTADDAAAGGETYEIGITQIVSHPSLDAAREGFKEALAEEGIEANYDEQNAQGDQATATNIANNFVNKDLVLSIATPTTQAAAQVITGTPVVFTAVTDPVAAGIVESIEAPGANVTGTSDLNPVKEQLELVKEIAPEAQTVGIVYSSGESNSEVQVQMAQDAAAELGLTIQTQTVSNSGEVAQAAQSLNVDAFYVPTDNVVVSAIESMVAAAEAQQIPMIVAEGDSVERGGVATVGIDYGELGRQTGKMAAQILRDGADPATMPVEYQDDPRLIVNPGAAEQAGIELPQELIDRADEVVQ